MPIEIAGLVLNSFFKSLDFFRKTFRTPWQKVYGLYCRSKDWLPSVPFRIWLFFACARHRRRAVLICRFGAMGDLICTLPVCEVVRQRHPKSLLVFVTAKQYHKLLLLSNAVDAVYGSKFWKYPYVFPKKFNVFGLVEAIYRPQTKDEQDSAKVAELHLVDDLARSCGFTVKNIQPRLYPTVSFIKQTLDKLHLSRESIGQRPLIVINVGPTWPIKMWNLEKWQNLVDAIKDQCNAVVVQLSAPKSLGVLQFHGLSGVRPLFDVKETEEIVALIAAADLLVAIDSGPIHIAGAVGTPVVGIFGPTNPIFYLPQDSPSVGLFKQVPCQFCHNKNPIGHSFTNCPHDIQCMKQIEVDVVLKAVNQMLKVLQKDKTSRG
jgi:ADP-heptose:LPS heptosyltransferase